MMLTDRHEYGLVREGVVGEAEDGGFYLKVFRFFKFLFTNALFDVTTPHLISVLDEVELPVDYGADDVDGSLSRAHDTRVGEGEVGLEERVGLVLHQEGLHKIRRVWLLKNRYKFKQFSESRCTWFCFSKTKGCLTVIRRPLCFYKSVNKSYNRDFCTSCTLYFTALLTTEYIPIVCTS